MKTQYIAVALVALVVVLLLWRIDNLGGKLDREKDAHNRTKSELAIAIEKGLGWKLAYETALNDAANQAKATQACLDREAEAIQAQGERKAILQAAQPRQRTEQEKTEVVDDATRNRFADRLNRPL